MQKEKIAFAEFTQFHFEPINNVYSLKVFVATKRYYNN